MPTLRSAGLALVAGAVSGIVVLGIMGRVAMVVVARGLGVPANFSFRGLVEVSVLGGLVGAVGGLLLLLARRMLPGRRSIQSLLVAGALFLGTLAVAVIGGRTTFGTDTMQPLTLAVVAIVFLGYGGAARVLLGWLEGRDRTGG
jgi:hypothetical protein